MIAEILSTGDEIRSGALIDSNSAFIAQNIEQSGISVSRHSCVGDHRVNLELILKEISTRADIAVVTGGLGPTLDDLSREAAADASGVDLVFDPAALIKIEQYFKNKNVPMNNINRKQAMLPKGADSIKNPVGTAPGFEITINNCLFFFLPGVPYEMRYMLNQYVLPRLQTLTGNSNICQPQTISCFGLPESDVDQRLTGLSTIFPQLQLGLRAKFPEIQVKLYADPNTSTKIMEDAQAWVVEKLGTHVFSFSGASMAMTVGHLLKKQGATLALAESCTGGLIADWLTNVPGSSAYFLFSGVVYSNAAKIKVLNLAPAIIEKYGAVHAETARAMARGASWVAGSDYGLAVSGIAGPEGGTPEKPVGTVCIGISDSKGSQGYNFCFSFNNRKSNKIIFAMQTLNLLRLFLMDKL